jgi:hypothetical protein
VNKPFGAPALLPQPINSSSFEDSATLTADELTIVYLKDANESAGNLLIATRASADKDFGTPTTIDAAGTNMLFGPSLSSDGLTLFWSIELNAGTAQDNVDIKMATRSDTKSSFANAQNSPWSNSNFAELYPAISPDGTEFYYGSDQATKNTNHRLGVYRSTKAGSGWNPPAIVSELTSSAGATNAGEQGFAISGDGLTMYLGSDRTGSQLLDVWVSHRSSKTAAWGTPTIVPELNSDSTDIPSFLSRDGCRIYLGSDRGGGTGQLYMATKPAK